MDDYTRETIRSNHPEAVPDVADESLVLICPFDGIGGARRALELLNITPALYVSIEPDPECRKVVKNAWPDVIQYSTIEEFLEVVKSGEFGRMVRDRCPKAAKGLVPGGPPCQPFAKLSKHRRGWSDPRSQGARLFPVLIREL